MRITVAPAIGSLVLLLAPAAGSAPAASSPQKDPELEALEARLRSGGNREKIDALFDAAKKVGTVAALRLIPPYFAVNANAYLSDRAIAAFSEAKDAGPFAAVAAEALKDPEDRVRIGALEAVIRRRGDTDASLAVPLLADKDPEIVLLALEAVLMHRPASLPPQIPKLASSKQKDATVRGTALLAWATLDAAGAARAVAEARADKNPRLRIASLLASRAAGGNAANEALAALTDTDRRVRFAALDWIEAARPAAAIDALIALVEVDQGRVRDSAVAALRAISQRDFGTDAKAWARWREQVGPAFEPPAAGGNGPTTGEASAPKQEVGTRVDGIARYHELVVASDRVAFVIDVSGSMRETYAAKGGTSAGGTSAGGGAVTKHAVAADALRDVLRAMPKGTHVTLILFNSAPLRFKASGRKAWLEVDDRLPDEAHKWMMGIGASNATNVSDSLALVLDDPEVDTVYLLTDGEPSAGERNLGSRIADWAERVTRFSRTRVHTIGLGTDDKAERFLRDLARSTGGTYVGR